MQSETAEQLIPLGRGRAATISRSGVGVAESAPTRHAAPRHARGSADSPSVWELVGEALDLFAGLTVTLLPLVVLSVPGLVLFVLLPGILVGLIAAGVALLGTVVIGPPLLIVRAVRRRRSPGAE